MNVTKRLEEAIELVRSLPEDEQDRAAELVFVYLSNDERQGSLDENEPALIQS
jgi:hypothetical protein